MKRYLGFTRNQFEEWGTYPIFMLGGKSGVALFPADAEGNELNFASKNCQN